jgi:hypothetical protein
MKGGGTSERWAYSGEKDVVRLETMLKEERECGAVVIVHRRSRAWWSPAGHILSARLYRSVEGNYREAGKQLLRCSTVGPNSTRE